MNSNSNILISNNEKKSEEKVLSKIPDIQNAFVELKNLRIKEIKELKDAQRNCQKIVDCSRNLDFEKASNYMLEGIKYSVNKANDNLKLCFEMFEITSEEELSPKTMAILQNRCADHVVNLIGRLKNFSNELELFIKKNNQNEEALSVAKECATSASTINIIFTKSKDLCCQFDKQINYLICTLTQRQLSEQIDNNKQNIVSKSYEQVIESNPTLKDDFVSHKHINLIANLILFAKQNTIKVLTYCSIFVPAVLVFSYLFIFCNSMFISESEFTINTNSEEKTTSAPTAQALITGGFNNDIYIATAYIKSFSLFNALDKKLELRKHYQKGDLFSALPINATIRDIKEYWNDVVNIDIDTESELLKLSVRSYSPEFSLKIQNNILRELDTLINQMNEKAHRDAVHLAEKEVQTAEKEVERTALELKKFRDNHTFINPEAEISNITSIVGSLEKQLSETKTDLEQKLTYFREDSLEVKTLKSKISALNKQLNEIRTRIAGNTTNNNLLSKSINEYEKLILIHEFAKKKLESAMTSLETSRQISLTKTRYLVMVESPTLPDESLWPTPFKSAFTTFLLSIFFIGIISLIISALREHMGV
jgi:capsular polysaccharide transport system permease protein